MIKQGIIKKKIEKNRIYLSASVSKIKEPLLIKCKYCFTNVMPITFIQINKKEEN